MATVNASGLPPTYFLAGNWAGTASVNTDETYNVRASVSQTATSFSATLTVLAAGNVPLTYTVNGQINGNVISYTIASSDTTEDVNGEDVTGTISSDGLQVAGSGLDGSSGTMTWDGKDTLTGSIILVSDAMTWSTTATVDGQQLTGVATSPTGDSVSWTFTIQ